MKKCPTDAHSSIANARAYLDLQIQSYGGTFQDWYRNFYLRSAHWKNLRARKFSHTKNECHYCRKRKELDAHHLRYKAIYDVLLTDLQIVCRPCHTRIHQGKPPLSPPRKAPFSDYKPRKATSRERKRARDQNRQQVAKLRSYLARCVA